MKGRLKSLVPAIVLGALVIAVQHRCLGSFFAADDLQHLEQAAGLRPTVSTPWRVLSQVLYFRFMLRAFGPHPVPFLLAGLLVHALNAMLVFRLLKTRLELSASQAFLTATLFGASPLVLTTLWRAVTINDTLALGFTLLALEWVYSERRWCPWAAPLLFAFAILSKESVILLPWCFVLWRSSGMTARRGMRRVIPMAAVSALAAAAFWMLRRGALAPTGAPYETRLGTNVLHNAAVYAGWLVSTAPVPELARYRELLPLALLLLGLTLVSYAACPACRRPLLAGAAWWLLAIAPVLVLVRSRYANYAYASLVGGYLVTVSVLACAGSWLAARRRPSAGARAAAALSVAALYVVLATGVLSAHLSAVVPGTELPRDPVLRGILVARQLVESFTREKQPEDTLVAIVAPPELQIALGARSGRRYRSPAGYDLLEAVSDSGRALRVFDPGVRDVAYVHDWQRHLRGRTIFVPFGPGYLYRAGRGTSGHLAAARLLVAARRADLALVYLDRAIAEDGPDSSLVELREVVRARRAPSPAP